MNDDDVATDRYAAPSGIHLVLVAEDDPEIAAILTGYLSRAGLLVLHAADGWRALEMHKMQAPDVVLLDVQMPRIGGWDVLAEIRRRGDTPVLMLTAQDRAKPINDPDLAADSYVVKPFDPNNVVARTLALLMRRQNGA